MYIYRERSDTILMTKNYIDHNELIKSKSDFNLYIQRFSIKYKKKEKKINVIKATTHLHQHTTNINNKEKRTMFKYLIFVSNHMCLI